jgi:hypothetical protein
MPLQASTLKQQLDLLQKNKPTSIAQAANLWANAVYTYTQAGLALYFNSVTVIIACNFRSIVFKKYGGRNFHG